MGAVRAKLLRAGPPVAVLALVVAGLLVALLGHWRRGTAVLAVGIMLAGVLRLALPTRHVGVLAVRSRAFDASFSLLLAALLGALALAGALPGD